MRPDAARWIITGMVVTPGKIVNGVFVAAPSCPTCGLLCVERVGGGVECLGGCPAVTDASAAPPTPPPRGCHVDLSTRCWNCGNPNMRPEHSHYRCDECGWRDSCCQ